MPSFQKTAIACWLALGLSLVTTAGFARDIFIGTLEVSGKTLQFRRCDLAENTYALRDAGNRKNGVVANFLNDPKHTKGIWYAEVIGEYEERGGKAGLAVFSFEELQANRNCHLTDIIEKLQQQ